MTRADFLNYKKINKNKKHFKKSLQLVQGKQKYKTRGQEPYRQKEKEIYWE